MYLGPTILVGLPNFDLVTMMVIILKLKTYMSNLSLSKLSKAN